MALLSTALALAVYAVCRFFLKEKPDSPEFLSGEQGTVAVSKKPHPHPLEGTSLRTALWAFATSSRVGLVIAMLMSLTCAMAFLDFLPAYLMENYQRTPSQAAMTSSYMPLGSLLGLVASIFAYDQLSKRQLRQVLPATLIVATLCIVGLQFLPQASLPDAWKLGVAKGLILVFGIMTSPAYYIPMSIFSIEFGGPHSAALVCLIDMSGFAASATFWFVGGRVAAGAFGWAGFMTLLIAVSVAAALTTWLFMNGEYRAAQVSPADGLAI